MIAIDLIMMIFQFAIALAMHSLTKYELIKTIMIEMCVKSTYSQSYLYL